ncbi:MAG: hypothetical protein GXY36_01470, partial [Chloroflexi bacterium]|nr:hypothetical protein [Chloroflexota bacterium]
IPTYFEPIPVPAAEPGRAPTRWLVDGGVGSFGNPALVVAREMMDARSTAQPYDPAAVTLFSFGTGYVPTEVYDRAYGSPAGWWAIEWAERVTDLFTDDAIREQTRSIPAQYPGVDLRRFQVTLDRVVDPDRFDLIDSYLAEKGEELRRLVLEQRHALALPESGAAHDPEHLLDPATAALLRRTLPG